MKKPGELMQGIQHIHVYILRCISGWIFQKMTASDKHSFNTDVTNIDYNI